jgi:hypothetical protein
MVPQARLYRGGKKETIFCLNLDSAVEREVKSKEQTFRSEDMPFGIANGKTQIPKYGICNLRSEIPSASEDLLLQARPSLFLTAESGLNGPQHSKDGAFPELLRRRFPFAGANRLLATPAQKRPRSLDPAGKRARP